MTVDSYLELFTTLFGWTFYGVLWDVLVTTGIVYLPFLGILIDNWREPAEGGQFGTVTGLSLRRMEIEPIGVVRSCFGEKFGAPRQPGLCPSAWGELVFGPEYRREEMVRGLDGFSHLWLVFGFDRVAGEGWSDEPSPADPMPARNHTATTLEPQTTSDSR